MDGPVRLMQSTFQLPGLVLQASKHLCQVVHVCLLGRLDRTILGPCCIPAVMTLTHLVMLWSVCRL